MPVIGGAEPDFVIGGPVAAGCTCGDERARHAPGLRSHGYFSLPAVGMLVAAMVFLSLALGAQSSASAQLLGALPGSSESRALESSQGSIWVAQVARDIDPPPPPSPSPSPTPSPTPVPTVSPRTSPEGLTLWSDGDSASYFMTTNLLDILSGQGALPVRDADYKISAMLTAPSGSSDVLHVPFTDWFSYAAQEMASYDPDIVVFMVGANDAAAAVDPSEFGAAAGEMMDLLHREGRIVAWVGLPSFTREDLAPRVPGLNAASQAAAASRSWVTYIDTSGISPDGSDGVHFSPSQGRLLALAVVHTLFPGLPVD